MHVTFIAVFAAATAFACFCVGTGLSRGMQGTRRAEAWTDAAWGVIPLAFLAYLGLFLFGHA